MQGQVTVIFYIYGNPLFWTTLQMINNMGSPYNQCVQCSEFQNWKLCQIQPTLTSLLYYFK